MTTSKDLAVAAARAADDKSANQVSILDVRELIVITDYFVIAGAATDRQARTIAQEVERVLREQDVKPVRREGERDGRWILLDYVDLVVHVFHDVEREYYGLERLWGDAPVVSWENRAASGA